MKKAIPARGLWQRYRRSAVRYGVRSASWHGLIRCIQFSLRLGRPAIVGEKLVQDDFDTAWGVDTAHTDEVADLATIDSPNWVHGRVYQTISSWRALPLFRSLALPWEEFVFLDLGSGKGKMLLLAAELPFRRIVGVEYCRSLHDVAVRNIQNYKNPARRCLDVTSTYADATRYPFPTDPLVVFMFNPFGPPVMRLVLERLSESVRSSPRRVLIVYVNPVHSEEFARTPFVSIVRGEGVAVFENSERRRGDLTRTTDESDEPARPG
jgi:predicted RNA methylase